LREREGEREIREEIERESLGNFLRERYLEREREQA